MHISKPYEIYLELGNKKIFACAVQWPGWDRSGHDEGSALETLLRYAARYNEAIKPTGLEFVLPQAVDDFTIIERIEGNFATSYGVPNLPISRDYIPPDAQEIERLEKVLRGCWLAFGRAVESGQGMQLRKGPRGGGRELAEIIDHVAEAEGNYVRRLGCNAIVARETNVHQKLAHIHQGVLNCIEAAATGQVPQQGTRPVKRWPLPYFVRRVAWHVLDHAWEIEDRII